MTHGAELEDVCVHAYALSVHVHTCLCCGRVETSEPPEQKSSLEYFFHALCDVQKQY